MEIVATTSLPAVDRPNADHWNAARSRQLVKLQYQTLSLNYAWNPLTSLFYDFQYIMNYTGKWN